MELVSIITPSYNSKKFILETINSVISQTYKNWEMLIIDDYSNDGSVSYIKAIIKNEKRIKLILLKQNVGAAEARNKALEKAQGRYIAFLDSDDIWYPNKLELQIQFMKTSNYPISFTSYEIIDEKSNLTNKRISTVESLTMEGYVKNTIIGFSTSMIDKKYIDAELKFDNIRIAEDLSFWINILKCGYKAYGLDITLLKYRVHSNSLSSNKLKSAKQILYSFIYIHKFGIIKSFYYFTFYAFNAIKKRILS